MTGHGDAASLPPQRPSAEAAGDASEAQRSTDVEATELVADRSDSATAGEADAALVRRMAGGDEQALGALYDRWSPSVRALALNILRSADEADGVTEETFWQAWRQAERYDTGRGSVSAWLLTVARSRALDRARAKARSREETRPATDAAFDSAAARDDASSFGAAPDEAVEAAERRVLVAKLLRELPDEQREAVTLAYFDGLSQTEIAERTGQPLGTIKTRVRLALRKLRERMTPLAGEFA